MAKRNVSAKAAADVARMHARQMLSNVVLPDMAGELVAVAQRERGFQGFTGHTQFSYTYGIWEDGEVVEADAPYDDMPRRGKVRKGERVFLSDPVEGRKRGLVGQVDIVNDDSVGLAKSIVESEKPRGGTGIVIATGTEYSEYLEQAYPVLTPAYNYAAQYPAEWIQTKIDMDKE